MSRILLRIEEGKMIFCDDDGIGNEHHEWQPDQSTYICSLCSSQFSFFKRKQLGFCFVVICSHCRICGRIFCSTCSSHKLMCSDKGKPEVSFVLFISLNSEFAIFASFYIHVCQMLILITNSFFGIVVCYISVFIIFDLFHFVCFNWFYCLLF